ncbi:heme-binding domain-containing protein [Riemerella anatipestifer]|uniref:heme-binding domain-containing protein n=1 Tax=Riemerella anatipestifer TaxID=34085 RepID=UPI00129E2380|nr:heme-binding domain-containing protein [Riemerella anatipestifer]MDY3316866.1 heme-binding domain-containing protein [Riemerella anatipestifer]MDY3318676.1 heme-binding domain-containing protein [Riemerella anatipestifer]MDY3324947.1 heme-binding domain-containing protein [Riemerella anatipestifer]MDY3350696.1 heme-binding domain-containing protein [Riemerella anatipestifer]MDY3353756.1 heme-binding domain-containing protein [Riemerella anatipestifer]
MKKVALALFAIGIILQFFQIDKTNPAVNQGMDFTQIKKMPESTAKLLRNACYDCHSNETKYPWYTNIQPVAWLVKEHIDDGRKHLNFSTFATYSPEKQTRKIEESIEEIEKGGMPLESYLLVHSEAKLSDGQKQELLNFLKQSIGKTSDTNTNGNEDED